jgi:hypothetical protein
VLGRLWLALSADGRVSFSIGADAHPTLRADEKHLVLDNGAGSARDAS